jgi:hypothetical protein
MTVGVMEFLGRLMVEASAAGNNGRFRIDDLPALGTVPADVPFAGNCTDVLARCTAFGHWKCSLMGYFVRKRNDWWHIYTIKRGFGQDIGVDDFIW